MFAIPHQFMVYTLIWCKSRYVFWIYFTRNLMTQGVRIWSDINLARLFHNVWMKDQNTKWSKSLANFFHTIHVQPPKTIIQTLPTRVYIATFEDIGATLHTSAMAMWYSCTYKHFRCTQQKCSLLVDSCVMSLAILAPVKW